MQFIDPILATIAETSAEVGGKKFSSSWTVYALAGEWKEDRSMIYTVGGVAVIMVTITIIPATQWFHSVTGTTGWIQFLRVLLS